MVLAELEIYHSRAVAPTRRVSVGRMTLPADPPPGFGGILLGAIVARNIGDINQELIPDLMRLSIELEEGTRVPQPRLRYRYQDDKVGLQPSRHRLVGHGEELSFAFEENHGLPVQQILGALYAAGQLHRSVRPSVMQAVRRAVRWRGGTDGELITTLAGAGRGRPLSPEAFRCPVSWASGVLGIDPTRPGAGAAGVRAQRGEVQRRFREGLMAAHPDHGGSSQDAALRIAELTEARRILLG